MMKNLGAALILASALFVSCSTTRLVPEGKYRLASNKVEVKGEKLSKSELSPFIRQKANKYFILGWNPFLNIYNWSDGSGKGINKVWEKLGTAPVVFDPLLVEASKKNIGNHMRYLGYYDANVDADVATKGRLANVTYKVRTGGRHIIGKIVYDVPGGEFGESFNADTLNMLVKEGSYLNESVLEAESARGAAYFRNLGYYDLSKNNYFFEADTLAGKDAVLYYRIKGYTRNDSPDQEVPVLKYTIGEVKIHHSEDIPFRPALLKKFNTIRPGLTYNEKMVNNTYTRLSALKVFNNVSVEMTPTDSATVNCDIRLGGVNPMGYKANLELSTNASGLIGISPQINMFHKNIFHGGEWLTIGFTGNWQFMPRSSVRASEFGISAGLSFPQLLGIPVARLHGANVPRTEIKASYNYQNRPEYTRAVGSVSFGYSGKVGTGWTYQVYPLQVNLSKLYSISEDFLKVIAENPLFADAFDDHLDAGLGGNIYYRSNPDIVPKTSYSFLNLGFDVSGNVISLFDRWLPSGGEYDSRKRLLGVPYYQYVKGETSFGYVFRFGADDGQAIATRFNAGIGHAYGNSYSLPWEKLLYCGGASSMRGWQARTLGPGFQSWKNVFAIPSQVGDLKLEADFEYRFKMFWKLEGALFAEVGNVWDKVDLDDFAASIAGDWGLGIRVNLDFILLRVDAGFKVREPSRPEGERWLLPSSWFKSDGCAIHFGVGYPF